MNLHKINEYKLTLLTAIILLTFCASILYSSFPQNLHSQEVDIPEPHDHWNLSDSPDVQLGEYLILEIRNVTNAFRLRVEMEFVLFTGSTDEKVQIYEIEDSIDLEIIPETSSKIRISVNTTTEVTFSVIYTLIGIPTYKILAFLILTPLVVTFGLIEFSLTRRDQKVSKMRLNMKNLQNEKEGFFLKLYPYVRFELDSIRMLPIGMVLILAAIPLFDAPIPYYIRNLYVPYSDGPGPPPPEYSFDKHVWNMLKDITNTAVPLVVLVMVALSFSYIYSYHSPEYQHQRSYPVNRYFQVIVRIFLSFVISMIYPTVLMIISLVSYYGPLNFNIWIVFIHAYFLLCLVLWTLMIVYHTTWLLFFDRSINLLLFPLVILFTIFDLTYSPHIPFLSSLQMLQNNAVYEDELPDLILVYIERLIYFGISIVMLFRVLKLKAISR